jgi:hypothetical protein
MGRGDLKMKHLLLLLALITVQAEAKMCEAITTTGEKVYKFVGTPTKSASGLVATMAKCPVTADISIAKVELKDVVLTGENIKNVVFDNVIYQDRIVYVDKIEERITYNDVVKDRIVYVDKPTPRPVYYDVPTPRPVYQDYVAPNPRSACEKTLQVLCDDEYGGVKLFTTSSADPDGVLRGNCIGLKIESGTPPDSNEVFYAYPLMYSGYKVNPDGSYKCVFE